MYASFYNLNENPFNLTPDPKYHYVNDSTREALASLLYGIESRKGFITLVGDAGTGKTTLLRRVFETIENETRIVFVFNPGVSFDELLEFICIELGIRTDSFRRLHLLDRLNQYLLEQLTDGYNVVVMIDEAQTLDDKVLEELRLLTNLETSKEKILQIVLSGQPELEDKLRKPSMRQLRQRIGARASLQPMKQNEIGPYIESRLRSAGSEEGQLFTAPALRKIWLASKGIPRIVNVICDNALVIGFAKSEQRISTATVKEAIGDLAGEDPTGGEVDLVRLWLGRPMVRYVGAATAALAVGIPFALSLMFNRTQPEQTAHEAFSGRAGYGARIEQAKPPIPAPTAVPTMIDASAGQPEAPATVAVMEAEDPLDSSTGTIDQAGSVPNELQAQLSPLVDSVIPAATVNDMPEPKARNTIVEDTIRRAEVLARSAAARLYEKRNTAAAPPRPERVAPVAKPTAPKPAPVKPAPVKAAKPEPKPEPVAAAPVVVAKKAVAPKPAPEKKAVPVTKAKPAETPKAAPVVQAQAVQSAPRVDKPKEPVQTASVKRPVAPARRGIVGLASGQPPVGRLVRVRKGDTIWKIASRYYPEAGSATVDALLARNPALKSAGPLYEDQLLLLPFLTAQEMVVAGSDGSYNILLSKAPSSSHTDAAMGWVGSTMPKLSVRSMQPRRLGEPYELYAVGFISRNDALAAADYVLFKLAELRAGRKSRQAGTASRARYAQAPPSTTR